MGCALSQCLFPLVSKLLVLFKFVLTGPQSAKAAVDDVARIAGQFAELESEMQRFTPEDIIAADISGRFLNFGQELNDEMTRIAENPALFVSLAEAFENFDSN